MCIISATTDIFTKCLLNKAKMIQQPEERYSHSRASLLQILAPHRSCWEELIHGICMKQDGLRCHSCRHVTLLEHHFWRQGNNLDK